MTCFFALQAFHNIRFRLLDAAHHFNDDVDLGVVDDVPRIFRQFFGRNGDAPRFVAVLHQNFFDADRRADPPLQIFPMAFHDADDACADRPQTEQAHFDRFHDTYDLPHV